MQPLGPQPEPSIWHCPATMGSSVCWAKMHRLGPTAWWAASSGLAGSGPRSRAVPLLSRVHPTFLRPRALFARSHRIPKGGKDHGHSNRDPCAVGRADRRGPEGQVGRFENADDLREPHQRRVHAGSGLGLLRQESDLGIRGEEGIRHRADRSHRPHPGIGGWDDKAKIPERRCLVITRFIHMLQPTEPGRYNASGAPRASRMPSVMFISSYACLVNGGPDALRKTSSLPHIRA